jgi:hypothetical protein
MGVFLRAGKLNNRHDPIRLGEISRQNPEITFLTAAENVDFANNGMATLRQGRLRRYIGVPHSLWTHPQDEQLGFFVEGSQLKRLNTDFTATTLATLSTNNPVYFTLVNGEVVGMNGVDIGWVNSHSFDAFAPTLGQFEIATPAGRYATMLNGVMYLAVDSVLYATKPHNVERCDERFCQLPMDGGLRMVGAVEDGLWVATEKSVGFVNGGGVDDFTYVSRCTDVPPDGAFVEDWWTEGGTTRKCVVWPSEKGFVVGLAGGALKYIDSDNIALPPGAMGRCFARNINGIEQYIAVILNPQTAEEFAPPDLVVTTLTVS